MPECDFIAENNRAIEFNQQWLNFSIPPDSTANNKIANCVRYAPVTDATTNNLTTALPNGTGQCTADSFNTMQTIECTEYVYASDERNIQTEVSSKKIHSFTDIFARSTNLMCDTFQLNASEII